jgi:hypothetical protein
VSTIVVSGALANKPLNGGEAWVRLSWIRGLQKLGFEVVFIEQIAASTCTGADGKATAFEESLNPAYFKRVTEAFGLTGSATLLYDGGVESYGSSLAELMDVAADADMLINISGHLSIEPLMQRFRRRAYIDIDPGFTQMWAELGTGGARLEGHDLYFTIGENIGRAECSIPFAGVQWRPVRQPVVLEDWPMCDGDGGMRFTTIASWRGAFGPVEFAGKTYGLKVHEFRKIMDVPRQAKGAKFEIALSIHPGDAKDLAALREHGWEVVDPVTASSGPDDFRRYVQQSAGEFSVAQGMYVQTNSGWFSDRTIRYLASGRPAIVQETGFSRNIPAGAGLLAFNSPGEAVDAVTRVVENYDEHSQAARRLAETHFASDIVLGRLVEEVMST